MNIRYAISNRDRMICCSTSNKANVRQRTPPHIESPFDTIDSNDEQSRFVSCSKGSVHSTRTIVRDDDRFRFNDLPLTTSTHWKRSTQVLFSRSSRSTDETNTLAEEEAEGKGERRRTSRKISAVEMPCVQDDFSFAVERRKKKNISLPSKEKTYLIAMARLSALRLLNDREDREEEEWINEHRTCVNDQRTQRYCSTVTNSSG